MPFVENGKMEACRHCGQDKSFLFDCYPFGDRMMEQVFFEYYFDGTDIVVVPTEEAESYLAQGLDRNYWIHAAYKWLKVYDGTDTAICSGCHKDTH